MTLQSQSRAHVLRWQSRWLLVMVSALAMLGVATECHFLIPVLPMLPLQALFAGALLAGLVRAFHAATSAAALVGGLFTAALYLATPGWRTALWPLLALLLLTLSATRFGRARKENLGVAEGHHGRTAPQVAANLGIAALASVPLGLARSFHLSGFLGTSTMRMALAAALAEAAADTLSSELGEVLGGEPRLLTTLRPVPAGTDGAISRAGTFAGFSGAAIVAAVAAFALNLTPSQAAIVVIAAIAGLFIDSWLGAVFERKGWLNNDAVNFLSTLAAALLATAPAIRR